VSRIWVRDHWHGGWITVFWKQLHRIAAPFGELAWDHTRRRLPGASEEEIADAVADLLKRAHDGPGDGSGEAVRAKPGRRDRRVAARTRSSAPTTPAAPVEGAPVPDDGEPEEHLAEVIPMPIFDPFAEADKRW
jgi:hypothetical protein